MADETRHSRALEADIITDPILPAKQEALNGLKQFDVVLEMIETFLDPQRQPFRFRPSHLLHLHRVALMGISQYAGNFRPSDIAIGGSGPSLQAPIKWRNRLKNSVTTSMKNGMKRALFT